MPRSAVAAAVTIPEGKTLEDVMSAVQTAAAEMFPRDQYAWVEATQDGFCIIRNGEDLTRHAWSIDADGVVTIEREGAAVKRVVQYEKVTASFTFAALRGSVGRKFDIRVIGTGPGLNQDRFGPWFVEDSDEGIGSARKVFGGARVYWHQVDGGAFDHLDADSRTWLGSNRDAGYLSDLRTTADGLFASLNVDDDVPEAIVEALRSRALGFSVECEADRHPIVRGGKSFSALRNFRHPSDGQARVAIVSHPALRGEVIRLAASRKKENTVDENTGTAVADPKADEVIASARAEAQKAAEELKRELHEAKVTRVRAALDAKLAASKLPEDAHEFIRLRFEPKLAAAEMPSDEEFDAAVKRLRKLVHASEPGVYGQGVEIGVEPRDRLALRIENLFSRNTPGYVRAALARDAGGKTIDERLRAAGMEARSEPSFLRLFRSATGHDFQDLRSPRGQAVRASITTSTFGDAWENVINRVFLAAYGENPDFQDWRKVAKVVPIQNFVKQERMVKGGYANLSTVSEGANYTAFTSPGDQGHGYTPTKRGNTEDVTWESMLRDDVGALTDLPMKLGLAAARTLYEFVFDMYGPQTTSVTMDYDSTALYHANHSNTGTTALSATELIVVIKAMMKQADLSNSKRLGVMPKFVMVPIDLMNTIFDILKARDTFPGGSTADYEWIRRQALEAIVVRHWSDATDWTVAADPFEFPTCEVGFVNGQEQPELFVQDQQNIGSMFNSDKVTYKVRHAYGGTILRHEGVYGEVVAG